MENQGKAGVGVNRVQGLGILSGGLQKGYCRECIPFVMFILCIGYVLEVKSLQRFLPQGKSQGLKA